MCVLVLLDLMLASSSGVEMVFLFATDPVSLRLLKFQRLCRQNGPSLGPRGNRSVTHFPHCQILSEGGRDHVLP